jgi:hypothetical protein
MIRILIALIAFLLLATVAFAADGVHIAKWEFQADIVVYMAFAASFSFILMAVLFWASTKTALAAFFNGPDEHKSPLRLLGIYLVIFDGAFRGYIGISTKTMPDIPWIEALLIFGLLGLAKIPEMIALIKGVRLPDLPTVPEVPK